MFILDVHLLRIKQLNLKKNLSNYLISHHAVSGKEKNVYFPVESIQQPQN